MSNLVSYLIIFFVVKIFLVILFAVVLLKETRKADQSDDKPEPTQVGEHFYLLRSSMKRLNDRFLVGQIVFSNRQDCRLYSHHQSSSHSPKEDE